MKLIQGLWPQGFFEPGPEADHVVGQLEHVFISQRALWVLFFPPFWSDVDWESKDGHYRVRLEGRWIAVPDDAVITEPNRAGRTMVWPYTAVGGADSPRTEIRCFMPGSMG
jgi:hypothetical protein